MSRPTNLDIVLASINFMKKRNTYDKVQAAQILRGSGWSMTRIASVLVKDGQASLSPQRIQEYLEADGVNKFRTTGEKRPISKSKSIGV